MSTGIMEKGYKKLRVWQKADELAYQAYLETKSFPKSELLTYFTKDNYTKLENLRRETGGLLWNFYKSL